MTSERWKQVDQLVQSALELDPAEWKSYLDRECGDDAEVRSEIESLLSHREQAVDFIETPAVAHADGLFEDDHSETNVAPGNRLIGRYRIIETLGHGGMGAVYLAERADQQFEKKVALKILKRGLEAEELVRRFRTERQILANLDHPNIARLIDGGATEDQLPYLVMEYVDGLPIDQYCNEHKLTTPERLKLFRKVCAAVQYAHASLVVHRDLKPSNIIVTEDGTPKLLDFGIAKLLAPDGFGTTQTFFRAMTPDYASPEQVAGAKITTASDIYSLGVVLYELLAGARPYKLKTESLEELSRAICDTEPEKPSEAGKELRAKSQGQRADNLDLPLTPDPEQEANQKSKIQNLKLLRGDLDNIILMAMRKEPELRYGSVQQLSEDIQRHLDGLPVAAHKPTLRYRAAKFVRRNKIAVAAACVVLVAVVAGVIGIAWQARVARAERDRARLEAAKAARINEFLQNVLNFSNPTWTSSNPARNRKATIDEAVDDAAKRLETELAGEPEIQAEVQLTLGRTYHGQSRYDEAEKQFRSSIERFSRTVGEEHSKTLQAMLGLADTFLLEGKYAEADPLYRKVIPGFERIVSGDASQTKWLAAAFNDLGVLLNYQGKPAEAEPLLRRSLDYAPKLSGHDRSVVPIAMGNLAGVLRNRGELEAALSLYREARAEFRRLSITPGLEEATLLNNIGSVLKLRGDLSQAEASLNESRDLYLRTIGEEHQYSVYPLIQLADIYYLRGDYARAREAAARALEIQTKLFPKGHVDIALSKNVLGKIMTMTSEARKGEAVLREALQMRQQTLKEPHFLIAEVKMSLGENVLVQKRIDEAKSLLLEAEKNLIAAVGEKHPTTVRCRELLSTVKADR